MQYENRQNRPQQGHRQDQGAGSSQPSINLRNISFRRPLDPELFNSAALIAAQDVSRADHEVRSKSV